jgi:hypothetical protein
MGLRRVNCMMAAITMTRGAHAGGQAALKKTADGAPALFVCARALLGDGEI